MSTNNKTNIYKGYNGRRFIEHAFYKGQLENIKKC